METLLEVQNLTIYYQTKKAEIQAINNLSFKAKKGEFVAIIGKSGCGKTSILSAIAGLIPYEGKIIFSFFKMSFPPAVYILIKGFIFYLNGIDRS